MKARAFLLLLALFALASGAYALVQESIIIPYSISDDGSFLVCSKVPSGANCRQGSEVVNYSYGDDNGSLSKLEDLIGDVGYSFSALYWCADLNLSSDLYDYPANATTLQSGNTGSCLIDGVTHFVTFLDYTWDPDPREVKLFYKTSSAWYSTGEAVVVNESRNANITVVDMRKLQGSDVVEVDLSCDSNYTETVPIRQIDVNGSCEDADFVTPTLIKWDDSQELSTGGIRLVVDIDEDLEYGYDVGGTIPFVIRTVDKNGVTVSPADVNYAVRNVTGQIYVTGTATYDSSDGRHKLNYTIPAAASIGFIEFAANSSSDVGGVKYLYKARPYRANLSINGNVNLSENDTRFFIRDQIPIEFDIENQYGELYSINSTITYLNWTTNSSINKTLNMSLNETSSRYIFNVPGDGPGLYIVNVTVNHSAPYEGVFNATLDVRGFGIMLSVDSKYSFGEEGRISAWVEDVRNGTQGQFVPSNISFRLKTPASTYIELEESNTSTEEKHYAYFNTSTLKTLGVYTVMVSATDLYNYTYTASRNFTLSGQYRNEYVEATEPDPVDVTNFTTLRVPVKFTNINTNKIYNVTVSLVNETDYVPLDSEFLNHVTLNTSEMAVDMDPSQKTSFVVVIKPTENLTNGNHTLLVAIDVNRQLVKLPLTAVVNFTALLSLSPSELSVNTTTERSRTRNVELRNDGYRKAVNVVAEKSGNTSLYTTLSVPDNISAGSSKTVTLNLNFDTIGYYEGYVLFSANDTKEARLRLKVNVFEDVEDELEALSSKLNTLDLNITKLELDYGAEASELRTSMRDLKNKRSEMQSLYDAGDYGSASGLLAEIQDGYEELYAEHQRFLLSKGPIEGDGLCSEEESCTSPDCVQVTRCMIVEEAVCGDSLCGPGECESCPGDCAPELCAALIKEPAPGGGPGLVLLLGIVVLLVVVAAVAIVIVMKKRQPPGTAGAFEPAAAPLAPV